MTSMEAQRPVGLATKTSPTGEALRPVGLVLGHKDLAHRGGMETSGAGAHKDLTRGVEALMPARLASRLDLRAGETCKHMLWLACSFALLEGGGLAGLGGQTTQRNKAFRTSA